MERVIQNLYDSHVHFLGTAEYLGGVSLSEVASLEDLRHMTFPSSCFRGGFLIAFGWNPSKLPRTLLTKENLDVLFPNHPVMFSRWDGHASWLNSQALDLIGFSDSDGLLEEADHFTALEKLPSYSNEELKEKMKTASRIFLEQGFTHLRDMTSSIPEAKALRELANAGLLPQQIELNFLIKKREDLKGLLPELVALKKISPRQVIIQGIKIFYDGTLGGENARLSGCNCAHNSQLWTEQDFKSVLNDVWKVGLEIAVHCIGDQAVDDIVQWTREVSAQGLVGRLNIEHAEFVRPETIQKMKPLHVKIHMQPCHWFGDQQWLDKNPNYKKWAFPWESLRRAQIHIQFGSDSPVAFPSAIENFRALEESSLKGVRHFDGDPIAAHQAVHGSIKGTTFFKNNVVSRVEFDGAVCFEK